MATIFTSNYDGGYGNYYQFKADASESDVSVSNNTSKVTVDIYVRRTNISSSGAYNNDGTAWSIIIDGTTTNGTRAWDTRNSSDWKWLGNASKVITHNADGSKSITISASHTGNSASGASRMGNSSGKGTFTLTTIPRASSITATDANIESATTINISRASNNFTHTITYDFSGLTGTIATKTGSTSIGWTVPTTFYAKIPNAKTGTVKLTCTTYNGDTSIGTSTTNFTVTASEAKCKPSISATVIDVNKATVDLTGSNSKIVRYKSTARVTPSASAKNSATIKTITVNNSTVSGTYIDFTNVQSTAFNVVVTDSRGYTNSINLTPTIVYYVPLSINAEFYRPTATGSEVELKYNGNYFNASFGSVVNTLTVTWKYRKKGVSEWTNGGTLTPTKSGNTFSGEVSLGTSYNYQTSYDFILYVSDKLMSLNSQQTMSKGEPVFDYGIDKENDNYFNVNGYLYNKYGNSVITLNGDGQSGLYLHVARITIGETSTNQPIIFDVVQKNSYGKIRLMFTSGTIPDISTFLSSVIGYSITVAVYKFSKNVWDLYIEKSAENDSIEITQLQKGIYMQSVKIEWQNKNVISPPSGSIFLKKATTDFDYDISNLQENAKVLYDNSSGTSGTVTLSDNVSNYSYIEIFYKDNYASVGQVQHSVKVTSPDGKVVSLFIFVPNDSSAMSIRYSIKSVNISGTTITTSNYYYTGFLKLTNNEWYHANELNIIKVIGYE